MPTLFAISPPRATMPSRQLTSVVLNLFFTDMDKSGSIKDNFNLVKDKIDTVHITELWTEYPYKELFSLLKDMKYEGFCLAEIPENPDPDRILRYYKKLFNCLQ